LIRIKIFKLKSQKVAQHPSSVGLYASAFLFDFCIDLTGNPKSDYASVSKDWSSSSSSRSFIIFLLGFNKRVLLGCSGGSFCIF